MEVIFFTIEKRPYVFVFLLAFLAIGFLTRGRKRTLLFLFTGYLIAWGSEALSIRTGFPYGWYFYIYENLKGEAMNWGVPVWDSLSYTFLCFAGLSVAEYVMGVPPLCKGRLGGVDRGKLKITFLSAVFVVILDIVVDPLAHLGDRWFLGKIYYYPYPGFYFNVPVSNFIGWFFVATGIVGIYQIAESRIKSPLPPFDKGGFGGIFLYFGIFLFNWGITVWIGEWKLAAIDIFWISFPTFLVFKKLTQKSKVKNQR